MNAPIALMSVGFIGLLISFFGLAVVLTNIRRRRK